MTGPDRRGSARLVHRWSGCRAQRRRSGGHGLIVRFLSAALILMSAPTDAAAERYALIVSGATGGQEYARQYAEWTKTLSAILVDRMKFERERIITLADADDDGGVATAANVRKTLVSLREKLAADDLLFVVLIGHGTFDGVDAKFNLVGPDLESSHWLELLDAIPARLVTRAHFW